MLQLIELLQKTTNMPDSELKYRSSKDRALKRHSQSSDIRLADLAT